MGIQTSKGRVWVDYFYSLRNAAAFARRVKAGIVVNGEYGQFWVTTIRGASRLMADGYELANVL